MAEASRLGLGGMTLFLVITVGAFLPRAWYVNACAGGDTDGATIVQLADPALSELVDNLDKGVGFSRADSDGKLQPWAGSEPLYPMLVATVKSSAGTQEPARVVRWLQAALGALAAGFLFLFGCVAFQSRLTGIVAGGLAAFQPFWVINTTALADGTLVVFLVAGVLAFGALASQRHSALPALLFGLALGGLGLTRAALLPFVVAALLWFLRRAAQVPTGGRIAFLAFFGFAATLSPWLVRNFLTFNDVYPIVDSTYRHLWIGNNPNATGGPLDEAAPATVKLQASGVWNELKTNPAGTFARRIHAGLAFLFGSDWPSTGQLWRTQTPGGATSLVPYLPYLLYLFLLGSLLLAGLGWRWSYLYHNEALLLAVAAIWIPLPYILGHAGALAGARLPFDVVLLGYSAYALTVVLNPLHEASLSE